jgi:hypothetical protein
MYTPRRAIAHPWILGRDIERGRNAAKRLTENVGICQPSVTGNREQNSTG